MEERKRVVILAAGDPPTHPVPLRALREADFVVCCDSAYSMLLANHSPLPADFVVIGDGDSLPETDKRALGNRWVQVDEQDYNDLHKAMNWATAHFQPSTTHFTILGATGRREDHTLGNISYLVTFGEEHPGADIEMLTDHGRFYTMIGERTFEAFPRQQVSLFSFDPRTAISATGLQWPLDHFRPTLWWQATLNAVLADSFTVSSDGPILLFRTYDPKA
ncbi:MAG: thiamine diphosphokinase [Bacteroidales bacterium]|nr:thiamine diphosphokinase [Bacteroidales bacterium]